MGHSFEVLEDAAVLQAFALSFDWYDESGSGVFFEICNPATQHGNA